jgi:hypothetical protein
LEVELELGAAGVADEVELPLSDEDEPPDDFASPELAVEFDELSPEDEPSLLLLSPLLCVSGRVLEPAAPPLP